jgi:hypothetical protein
VSLMMMMTFVQRLHQTGEHQKQCQNTSQNRLSL